MSMVGKTYEADNRTGRNMEGPDANRPLERLTATSIIGDKVENQQGHNVYALHQVAAFPDGKVHTRMPRS